jgi:hypothetical protein
MARDEEPSEGDIRLLPCKGKTVHSAGKRTEHVYNRRTKFFGGSEYTWECLECGEKVIARST